MSDRVKTMRRELAERLTELETPGTWDHIVKQRGMFSMLGLQRKWDYFLKNLFKLQFFQQRNNVKS